jgi:hypothetical protein
MTKLVAISMFVVISAAGCCNQRSVALTTTVHTVDSVRTVTEVQYRDTTIYVPGASVATTFDCDSLVKALLKTPSKPFRKAFKQAQITLSADTTGRITATADCDEQAIEARLRHQITRQIRSTTTSERTEVPVKYVPIWVQVLAYIGAIAIVITSIKLFR